MKKLSVVIFTVTLLCPIGLIFANPKEANDEMPNKGVMQHDMKKKMGMMPGMMAMMDKKIVATSDGGVVILEGRKLIKYDKNLNLVKEVELKDASCPMNEMKKCCQKDKDGKKMCEMRGDKAEVVTNSEDHAKHH